jgi:hypothetical protein
MIWFQGLETRSWKPNQEITVVVLTKGEPGRIAAEGGKVENKCKQHGRRIARNWC